MKNSKLKTGSWLALLLLALTGYAADPVPPTTAFTRDFLRATNRAQAVSKLGFISTNQTSVTNYVGDASAQTNLNASELRTGTVPLARITGLTSNQIADGSIATNDLDANTLSIILTPTVDIAGNAATATTASATAIGATINVANGAALTNNNGLSFITQSDMKAWVGVTPWATGGSGSTSSVPVVVWRTLIQSSNSMHNGFPFVTYDAMRQRLIATWTQGTNHSQKWVGKALQSVSYDSRNWSSPVTNLNWSGSADSYAHTHYAISALRDGTLLEWNHLRDDGANSNATNILRQSLDGGLTWRTNSYPNYSAFGSIQIANSAVFETQSGKWLAYIFEDDASARTAFLTSTNRGVNWDAQIVDAYGGSEVGFATLGSYVYANVRRSDESGVPFVTYFSTNDCASWFGPFTNNCAGVGPYSGSNWGAHPYTTFLGNRMYVTSRRLQNYSTELLWFDDFPYYTNLTGRMVLDVRPSVYCSLLKLSENVMLAVGGGSVEANTSTFGSTNAIIFASVIAQDGVGWLPANNAAKLRQPYISLMAKDLPYRASSFVWPNGGTLPYDLTNANAPTLGLTNGVKLASSGNTAGWRILIADAIPFHNTNQLTVIWTGRPTNSANYASLLDANVNGTSSTGIRLWLDSVKGVQLWQGRWVGGSWAGNYYNTGSGFANPHANASFGVYCVRLTNNLMSLFYNGGSHTFDVANTGVGGYTNAGILGEGNNASISYALVGGQVGTAAAQGVLTSNMRIWTNSLTDGEIAELTAEQYRDAFLNAK